jgi:type IV pilus assembly protein PilB
MANPKDSTLIDLITKKANTKVKVYLATSRDIDNALRIYRKDLQQTFKDLLSKDSISGKPATADEAPIAKMVDLLIIYAYQDKASDIHIEPRKKIFLSVSASMEYYMTSYSFQSPCMTA